jgi:hypothetical protein
MIMGWTEVAKVTGVGAPERTEISITETSVTSESLGLASNEELLALLDKRRALPDPGIEDADFVDLTPGMDAPDGYRGP